HVTNSTSGSEPCWGGAAILQLSRATLIVPQTIGLFHVLSCDSNLLISRDNIAPVTKVTVACQICIHSMEKLICEYTLIFNQCAK
ncbi:12125_t:CDS:2, partial [Racocetra persica]